MSDPHRTGTSDRNVVLHPSASEWLSRRDDIPSVLSTFPVSEVPQPAAFFLCLLNGGLALYAPDEPAAKPLQVDFLNGRNAHRRRFGGGRQQDLARACGLDRKRDLTVLDATAGLGRDAFVLASLGARVTLAECQPIVWVLLYSGIDGLKRSTAPEDRALAERMTLTFARAGQNPLPSDHPYEVIYLDPMFPERRKSAAVKRDMQLMHELAPAASADSDGALLEWAIRANPSRVVVKRPRIAPTLDGREPSLQRLGKSNRFDIYTIRKISVV